MFPVIVLIGQKNVGKSTLFNKLTCTRDALISHCPGLTRDRQYGYFRCKQFKSIIIDTGGIDGLYNLKIKSIQNYIAHQTNLAVKEADIVLFMIDGQFGGTSIDHDIVNILRKLGKNIFIVINKIDDIACHVQNMVWDYHSYGIKNIILISAIHGYGIDNLLERMSFLIHKNMLKIKNDNNAISIDINTSFYQKDIGLLSNKTHNMINTITLAVVGLPNSGKSTFINYVLGKDRMITCNIPGTTRNSIRIPIIYEKQQYILIDTAGIRKKKKINDIADQISMIQTFKIIKSAHVVLFMVDANLGISDQDLYLLRFIINKSKTLVIVINKWDQISPDLRDKTRKILHEKIDFIDFVRMHFISSLYGNGFEKLFKSIKETYFCAIKTINTANLIRIMCSAITKFPPPVLRGKRIKPKYIHLGGYNPLTLIVHGAHVSKLPNYYQRYLKKYFYRMLNITGVLLRLQFKDTENPFINSKNTLK